MGKLLKTLAISAMLLAPASAAQAQISFGFRFGTPPAPRAYRVPLRPGPDYVWIEGYNYPEGSHYAWHDGYWTRPPYEGAYWVEPYYVDGQYYAGEWEGSRGMVAHDHRWDQGDQRDERRDFRQGGFYLENLSLNAVRRDLHDLDVRVTRAHEVAEAAMNGRSDASQNFFERIHALNDRVGDLHRYSDMDRIDRRDLRPRIESLSNEARSVDRALRQARAIPEVWDEWAAVLQTLDRLMDDIR